MDNNYDNYVFLLRSVILYVCKYIAWPITIF